DYLSLHLYVGNKENNFEEFMASSFQLQELTKTAEGLIRAALLDAPPNKKLYIAWDEWNVWYRERGQGKETGRHILEEHYNLEDALVIATFLNTFLNNAHIVKIANLAQLVNVIAPIFTNDKGLFLQTIYYPLQLFANNSKGNALELSIESPTYTSKKWGAVPYLDVSAADDNGSLVLNVVNRHRTEAVEAEFEPQDAQFSDSFEVAEVNGPDIKSENNFGSQVVGIKRSSTNVSNNRLIYRFSPHSYTMLKGRMA
ncbi:MAG TPA: alpha-L-arabinofuranosidase C-terminal domain-containing protein, partial [Bryobacteraceae bacterium]